MSPAPSTALKRAAALWVVWGIVHLLAGVIVLSSDASGGFAAIANAVDPDSLRHADEPAGAGILNQHGWNLAWGGAATVIGADFTWTANLTAIWVTAMVGGLLDIGYLLFVDVLGYVHSFPGALMTLNSASAIGLSFWVRRPHRKARR
ncbi:MAG: hypothetical protein AAF092_17840 [Pseudomonadota bacterium]